MRREEQREANKLLEEARQQWMEERKQLLKECEDKRQKSIQLEKSALESKLKEEFEEQMIQIHLTHENHVKDTVSRTWSQAEIVKDKIVEKVRTEERRVAKQIAQEQEEKVKKEKQQLLQEADEKRKTDLQELKEALNIEHQTQLLLLEQELKSAYDQKEGELCEQYDSELLASQQLLEDKTRQLNATQQRLNDMTKEKESWALKYNTLKLEFSDFIAQFPGFNADFLLK